MTEKSLAPKKLVSAHHLLVGLLGDGRPRPIELCLARAAAAGISERTLYEARSRLPIFCPDRDFTGQVPGRWRLISRKVKAPEQWRQRRPPRSCTTCGVSLAGEHWRRRRCRQCKRAAA